MPILSKIFSGGSTGSLGSRRRTRRKIVGVFYAEEGGYYAGRITYQPESYTSMLLGGDVYDLFVAPKSGGEASSKQYKTSRSCDGSHNSSGTTAPNSQYDGYYNTYTSVLGASSVHPAANFCRDLVLNGYSDWYLPTEREAVLAYGNLKNLPKWDTGDEAFQTSGGTNAGGYWLSFGDSCSNIGVLVTASKWFKASGLGGGYYKDDIQYVRAIRRVYVGRQNYFGATGGNSITTPGDGYRYHIFESPGSFAVTGTTSVEAEIAMVGGGGNGGTPQGDGGPGNNDSGSGGGGGGAFVNFAFNISGDPSGNTVNYSITAGGASTPTSFTAPTASITAGGGTAGPPSYRSDVPGGPGGTVSNPSNIPVIRSTAGFNGSGTLGADQAGPGGTAGHTANRSGEWWIPYMGPGAAGLGNFPAGTPGTPGIAYGGGGGGGAGQGGDPPQPGIGQGGGGAAGRFVIRYPTNIGEVITGFFMNNAPATVGGGGVVNVTGLAPFTFTSSSTFTAYANYDVRVKVRGGPGGYLAFPARQGTGGYVTGTVRLYAGQTYTAHCDPQGRYSALFYGDNDITAPVCIMLGAQGGYGDQDDYGSYTGYAQGGPAGNPGGGGGSWVSTAGGGGGGGGGGGVTTGYLTGSGGAGGSGSGPEGPQANGTPGGLFSAGTGGPGGTSAEGSRGGFGYFGGGGGGGYKGVAGGGGGGGGGGSNYAGGLPNAAPYPAIVTNVSQGIESGEVLIEIVSITAV